MANVDIAGAAASAQTSVAAYRAAASLRRPIIARAAAPAIDDAQAAARVVGQYFALIEAGDYCAAWRLWDGEGRGSGHSVTAFAAGFARFGDHHADIGTPLPIESRGGQLYVTFPIRIDARLRDDDRHVAMAGLLTMVRSADPTVPTGWRISASSIGALPAGMPAIATAHYTCRRAPAFAVRFDNRAGTATIENGTRPAPVMAIQRAASGIWYRGGGYELRGKGRNATLTRPGGAPVSCTAIG